MIKNLPPAWPAEFVLPRYDGRSIANVPATIAAILETPFAGLPPLEEALWRPVAGGAKRVVLLIIDALGWNLLQLAQAELAALLGQTAVFEPITSVFPSTTVAALSSLWTGVAPAQHGLIGFHLFFPEYATAGQMISFTPLFRKFPDALVEAGLEPEKFLQWPGVAEQLAAGGVPTYVIKGREIVDTTLSKMHGRGEAASYGAVTFADMLAQMAALLDEKEGEPLYLHAYWPTIDTLSHLRGWRSPATRAELRSLGHQIKTEFLDRLTAAARRDTVFFLTADHGQVTYSPEQRIPLADHPRLEEMLLMRPMGGARELYLYARQGQAAAVTRYFNEALGDAFFALPAEEALAAGLFGPEPFARQTRQRLGDVVAIARQSHIMYAPAEQKIANKFKAGHGGLSAAEMEAPWLGFRLDE